MSPASGRRAVLLAGAAAIAGGIWLLVRVREVLVPFALAGVLVYLVEPLVGRLHRRGLSRPWAILLSYGLLGLLAGLAVAVVVPDLVRELTDLGDLLPGYAARADALLRQLREGGNRLPAPVLSAVQAGVGHLQSRGEDAIRSATAGLLSVVGGFLSLLLAPFLGYYFLADLPRFRARLLTAVPARARPAVLAYLRDLDATLSGFVRGQLLTAAAIGALVALAMMLLRLQYALTLGVLAGIGELVPYFGPAMGALPGLAVAGAHSWRLVLEVALAYALIQQIESAILHPYIMGQTMGLHPLTVVFALLAGGELAGLAGLLLAVPVTGAVQVTGVHLVRAAVAWRREAALRPPPARAPAGKAWRSAAPRPAAPAATARPARQPAAADPAPGLTATVDPSVALSGDLGPEDPRQPPG
jgi:predicted PurR-regulated permease PerM